MRTNGRVLGRILAGVVVAAGAAIPVVQARHAAAATPLQCQISMQVDVTVVPITHLATYTVLTGGGSCFADLGGTYLATIVGGTGRSLGFGPGTNCTTNTTQNFTLTFDVTLTSTSTGAVRTVTETLAAPGVVALPGTAAVTASSPTKTSGGGLFSYRIFHVCPPAGNDSALFVGTIAN